MAFCGFHSFSEFNAYVTFVMVGMSIMMVISAITAAPSFMTEYFKYATGQPDAVSEAQYFWKNVNTFYNVGNYVPQLITELLTLAPVFRRISLRYRMLVALCIPFIELLVLIVVPVVTVPTQNGAIIVIMVVAVLGGFSKAVCDSTANALVGPFPTKFMNGEQWGLTVSSLFMSVLQCILKASMGTTFSDVLRSSRLYFGIAMGFQFLTLVQFVLLYYNPYAHKYIAEFRVSHNKCAEDYLDDPATTTTATASGANGSAAVEPTSVAREGEVRVLELSAPNAVTREDKEEMLVDYTEARSAKEASDAPHFGNAAVLRATGDADGMRDTDQVGRITSGEQMVNTNVFSVMRKVWPMMLCCFFVYCASMTLFPGVFFAVDPNDNWYGTIVVLLFCAGDFVSRIVLMHRSLRPSPMVCLIGCVARLVVVPLLALCVHQTIRGHWLPYVLMCVLSVTNGYFGTMAMIHCSRTTSLTTAGERSIAAIVCGICLQFGLTIGSNLALAINLAL